MTTEQQEAIARAEGRKDFYISTPGVTRTFGPLSERAMREHVDTLLSNGLKPLVLRVVEDYQV